MGLAHQIKGEQSVLRNNQPLFFRPGNVLSKLSTQDFFRE